MSESVIHIENLQVDAGKKTILQVSRLALEAGQVLAVMGPNGAGKSTLVKTCLGLRRFSAGRVEVLGHDVGKQSPATMSRLRRRIGYVAQDLAGRSEMPLTAREVVAIGRTGLAGLFRGLSRDDWHIVDEWLERLGLEKLAHENYGHLSGGEQRKTLIARAMVQQPALLMLDEPTAHLDIGWREQIVTTMQELYEQTHIAIVLVCHEIEVLPPCCERMALLVGGTMVGDGPPTEVMTDGRLAELYGPGLTLQHRRGRHSIVPKGWGLS